MILLIFFAFLAGIVTILSPCILPILPIILTGTTGGGKQKPLGIVTGFILSFSFFTLFLTAIVKLLGISADGLRTFSIVLIGLFGITLLVPQFQAWMETLFTKLSSKTPKSTQNNGFGGGLLLGLSLGLLWTPCVGPILASVITLAATSSVGLSAVFITLAYSIGTAIPMILIMYGGRNLLQKVPWLVKNTASIQKGFGVLMILTAVGIYFNVDRQFQTYILDKFPNYGVGLTQLEDNRLVKDQLNKLTDPDLGSTESYDSPSGLINDLRNYPQAPEFILGGQWFNSEPLTIASLKGKVVLVDFWTYTCINCIRTMPYLRDWHQSYADQGLVIIGVHTPEFEFEKDADNVQQALIDFELEHPIMQDNNYATWQAYKNRYWPAKYLIDQEGHIRYTHFGEGKYDETEAKIQELLAEIGSTPDSSLIDNPSYVVSSRTPETYLGSQRISNFTSPEKIKLDQVQAYTIPNKLGSNQFAFSGSWMVSAEYAAPSTGSELRFNFDSQDVFLVMRPTSETSGTLRVYLDDKLVSPDSAGADVTDGQVTVDTDRLYHLIHLPSAGPHMLKLEFEDDSLELFAFTFG